MKQLLTICLLASFLVSGWAACTAFTAGAATCSGADIATCVTGYKFDSTAKTCTACDVGKYSAGGTVATCVDCTAGKFCDGKNAAGNAVATTDSSTASVTQKACTAGNYCPAASSAVTVCPAGHYCPAEASVATPCETGKGTAATGQALAADCSISCTDTTKVKTCGPGVGDVASCRDGYVKVGTACEACGVDNAATCPSGNDTSSRMWQADSCKAGFFKTAATGTASLTNKDKCEACDEGCFTCTAKGKCSKAKKGFQLTGTAPDQKPAKCDGSGKTNLTDDHALTDCATECAETPVGAKNCLSCSAAIATCTQCKPNFEVKDAKCENIATTKHATCQEADKAADATACTKCDALLNREDGWNAAATPAETRGTCKCKAGFREPAADATDK